MDDAWELLGNFKGFVLFVGGSALVGAILAVIKRPVERWLDLLTT